MMTSSHEQKPKPPSLARARAASDLRDHSAAAAAAAVVVDNDMRQQRTDYSVSNLVVQPVATIWDEQVDPQSGRSYYINKSTAQTQWERPAEMDAPRTAAVS